MSTKLRTSALKRIRFAPVALLAGIFAAVLLSPSITGTLSGFAASITNSSNTAATGTLVMQEQNAGANRHLPQHRRRLGLDERGDLLDDQQVRWQHDDDAGQHREHRDLDQEHRHRERRDLHAHFPVRPARQVGHGTQNGTATDLCAKMNLVITSGSTTVFTGTLASFKGAPPRPSRCPRHPPPARPSRSTSP